MGTTEVNGQKIIINTTTLLLIFFAIIIGIGFIFLTITKNKSIDANKANINVVSTVEDKQVIEVTVNGSGYSPGTINAKADVPTIIRMKSEDAYGCERAFRIPSLKVSKTLPSNGNTDIEIASQKAGTNLKGACSMGMYNFTINFK